MRKTVDSFESGQLIPHAKGDRVLYDMRVFRCRAHYFSTIFTEYDPKNTGKENTENKHKYVTKYSEWQIKLCIGDGIKVTL